MRPHLPTHGARNRLRCWPLLLLVSCVAVAASRAQPRSPMGTASPHARLQAVPVAGVTGRVAGRVAVLVTLIVDPGWHVSWRNPGETGVPTALSWTLPSGVRATDERWPVPIITHTNVGATHTMEDTVPWLVTLAVPTSATSPRPLSLTVRYGVCREICIPAQLSLELSLPTKGVTAVATVPAALRTRLVDIGPAVPARRLSATRLCIGRLPVTGSSAPWEMIADTGLRMDAAMPLRPWRRFTTVATIPADAQLSGRPRMLFVQGERAIEARLELSARARGCTAP